MGRPLGLRVCALDVFPGFMLRLRLQWCQHVSIGWNITVGNDGSDFDIKYAVWGFQSPMSVA